MNLFLNIDTSLEIASVSVSEEDAVIGFSANEQPKNHSSWLHQAIQSILKNNKISANHLDAISVTIGPGSYTGIRMGLATAKGLCYALQKPLIAVNRLELIAYSNKNTESEVICPAIDARRMEIFFGLYKKDISSLQPAAAHILTETSFSGLLNEKSVLFCGNGVGKMENIIQHPNATFSHVTGNAIQQASITLKKFLTGDIASLVLTDPLYIKDFYTAAQKS